MWRQIAEAASAFQQERSGHAPNLSVVLGEDTLAVTLQGALTPAQADLAQNAAGAATMPESHRELFSHTWDALRQEIKRITSREFREGVAEVGPAIGTVVNVFTTGTQVQVFLLAKKVPS